MPEDELKACPFCLIHLRTQGNVGLYRHPSNGCILERFGLFDDDGDRWNTRRAQWVAVSERLPEKGECVIVEVENHTPDGGKWCEIVRWFDLTSLEVILCGEIINWLPLDWLPRPETADN